MRAIQITEFGAPEDVVHVVDLTEPPAPGATEVKVAVQISPLNRHDLLLISGTLVRPPLAGAWRERMLLPAEGLFTLPEGSVEQFSMVGSNPPTAGLILSEYTDLEPGDWIVQNAANSGVGRSLIALTKARGFRTINLARNESAFADLTASGADIVHLDDATAVEDVRKTIGDARVALAVDSVGGDAPARMLDLLSDGGSLVAYASATGQPMSVNTLALIGKRVTVRGFLAGQFDYATKVLPVIREAVPLVAGGALAVPPAAVFDLDDIHAAMRQVVRGGKALIQISQP